MTLATPNWAAGLEVVVARETEVAVMVPVVLEGLTELVA